MGGGYGLKHAGDRGDCGLQPAGRGDPDRSGPALIRAMVMFGKRALVFGNLLRFCGRKAEGLSQTVWREGGVQKWPAAPMESALRGPRPGPS